jgi:hypothetical protein
MIELEWMIEDVRKRDWKKIDAEDVPHGCWSRSKFISEYEFPITTTPTKTTKPTIKTKNNNTNMWKVLLQYELQIRKVF